VLVLSRGRDDAITRQMSKEPRDFFFCHFGRMPFIVVNNEPLDPIEVRLLSANAVMLSPNDVAYLVEQFWFVREPAARYYCRHGSDFRFPGVKLKPD
jgi:hypothetical protein